MANTFALSICVPDRRFLDMEATEVLFTTPGGNMGVMAGHMPMVASVIEGLIEIRQDDEWKTAAVSQGFAEITGDKVSFYVGTAEWATDIDTIRAKDALERAEMRLQSDLSQLEYVRTKTAMARALARLKAAQSINK